MSCTPFVVSLHGSIYAGGSAIILKIGLLQADRRRTSFFQLHPWLVPAAVLPAHDILSFCCAVFSGGGTALLLTPAWEYASPSAANRRRDTDRWRRQLTRLPRPFPQYPPLTLRYGMTRLLRCASGAACAGQWSWVPARTFDVIVLTGQRWDFTPVPASLSRRQSKRPKPYRSKVLLAY